MKKRLTAGLLLFLFLSLCLPFTASANDIPIPPADRVGDLETGEVESDFYRKQITGQKTPETEEGETLAPETDPIPRAVDPVKEILLPTAYVTLAAVGGLAIVLLIGKLREK